MRARKQGMARPTADRMASRPLKSSLTAAREVESELAGQTRALAALYRPMHRGFRLWEHVAEFCLVPALGCRTLSEVRVAMAASYWA